MIQATFDEAHSPAWIKAHIIDSMNELVLVRQVNSVAPNYRAIGLVLCAPPRSFWHLPSDDGRPVDRGEVA